LVAQAYNLSYFWRQRSGGSQVETQAKKSLWDPPSQPIKAEHDCACLSYKPHGKHKQEDHDLSWLRE
jgi:hypothetical protein